MENRIADTAPETLRVLAFLFGPPELLPNFLSGLICLALFEGAYVTEIVRAGIEAVPRGQWEAGRALGLRSSQVMNEVVLPQAVRRMIPALAGQFIALIKDSSLISLISIQELTFAGTELAVSSGRVFEVWLTVAALYFCCASGWRGGSGGWSGDSVSIGIERPGKLGRAPRRVHGVNFFTEPRTGRVPWPRHPKSPPNCSTPPPN